MKTSPESRFYARSKNIQAACDSLARKRVWDASDYTEAALLVEEAKSLALSYDVYHRLEMVMSFSLKPGTIMKGRS